MKIDIERIISGDAIIEELNLSDPVFNVLRRSGVFTILELISHSEEELMSLENGHLGQKGLQEIKTKVEMLNLPHIHLGFNENQSSLREQIVFSSVLSDFVELRNKLLELDKMAGANKEEFDEIFWDLDKLMIKFYRLKEKSLNERKEHIK